MVRCLMHAIVVALVLARPVHTDKVVFRNDTAHDDDPLPIDHGECGNLTFEHEVHDQHITGTLDSFDTVDAEIQITDFSWNGVHVCEPGLYTLPVSG